MDELSSPGTGDRPDSGLSARDQTPAGPIQPDLAGQLEREQAVFDLTDAAQADTRAATALARGDLAGSRQLTELARHLYDRADTHGAAPAKKEAPHRPVTATPVRGEAIHRRSGRHQHPTQEPPD